MRLEMESLLPLEIDRVAIEPEFPDTNVPQHDIFSKFKDFVLVTIDNLKFDNLQLV